MNIKCLKSATSFALLGVAAAALVACGGDIGAKAAQGVVAASYISKALITLDVNDDGVCNLTTEPQTISDSEGRYSFNPAYGEHMVCADGGYNTATNLPVIGQLKAPAGSNAVTPLNTLVMALAQTNPTKAPSAADVAAAQAKLETQLGLPSGAMSQDPVKAIATTPKIEQINASVQVLLQTVASSVTAFAGVPTPAVDASGNVKTAMNAVFAQAAQSVATTLNASAIDLTTANATAAANFVQNVVATTVTKVQSSPSAITALTAAAPTTAITTLSPTNAAAFVASNVAAVTQSVATTSLTGTAAEVKAALASAETTAQQNVTVAKAVTTIVSAAPALFVTVNGQAPASSPNTATAIAALAEAVLPANLVVANTGVAVNAGTLSAKLADAAAVTTTVVIDSGAISSTVATAISAPPQVPATVNISTQPNPTTNGVTITGSVTGTTTGSN